MEAVFFDLDGCLVDSTEAIPAAYNAALGQLGLPAQPPASLHRFIGPPLLEGFTVLLGELGSDPRQAAAAVDAYRAVYGELAATTTRVVPGIAAALERLRGLRLAVVTSKPAEFARPILATLGLAEHFLGLYAPALTATTEQKAAALDRALREIAPDADRRRCAMVGDRRHDVAAARACGTVAVGVTWGAGDRRELAYAGADVIVDAPAELPDTLLA